MIRTVIRTALVASLSVLAATRYSITSSTAIGWAAVPSQRGAGIAGKRSTSSRTMSNYALPAPITIEARSSIVVTPEVRRIRPTS